MMRRHVLAFAAGGLLLFGCGSRGPEGPPDLDGLWEGSILQNGDSHLFRLDFRTEGPDLRGRIDLPDQYALGYALRNVHQQGTSLTFELPEALPPTSFEGTAERGRIVGTFASTAGEETLRGTFEVWRRPRAEAPYHAEEVSFRNGDVTLSGTLFLPRTPGPHPALVFLHGSGPQTRESYLRYFADAFARRGMAALFYDKRHTNEPGLPPWLQGGGSFDELAGDALAGVQLLASRSDIDSKRIGLWGLSQGAWLAALAAGRSEHVAFAVLLSGGGVTPAEQELYDDEVKLRAHGFPEEQVAAALALLRLADDYVRSGTDQDWDSLQRSLAAARSEPWFRLLDRFPLILPREAPAWSGLRTDLDYDPRPILERLRIPVLAILGESDPLTPARETARRLETALKKAGNPDFEIRLVSGADHGLWRHSDPGTGWLGDRPAEGWVEGMLDWVLTRTTT